MRIDEGALFLIEQLEKQGYEAYVVGGCVRDSLLGSLPKDWDICTNALPEEIKRSVVPLPTIETGISHGTITVLCQGSAYEITTYRKEGRYLDNRHPETVEFVSDIKEDLSRRDFTVNSMAYHPRRGLIDFFDGKADLQKGMIRCVGEPQKRFAEDGLRIIRALRFASVYGFMLDEQTSWAIHEKKGNLRNISAERLSSELGKLLCGEGIKYVLMQYSDVMAEIIPEVDDMIRFKQRNSHCTSDIWQHTVKSVAFVPSDTILRLTMLLHDIGKPHCYSECESEIECFRNHSKLGANLAQIILKRLRFDRETVKSVTELVEYHDLDISANTKCIKQWLNRMGREQFYRLTEVWRANALAHLPQKQSERLEKIQKIRSCMETIIQQGQCFCREDLAVNGHDLISLGFPPGKQIGKILGLLMESVLEEQIENTRQDLLDLAQQLKE